MPNPLAPIRDEDLPRLGTQLRALALRLVADEATADDLAQEAWLALRRSGQLDARHPAAYLKGVLRNLFARRTSSEASRRRREKAVARAESVPSSSALDEHLETHLEMHQVLVEELRQLPEDLREVLLLRYQQNLSAAAIARSWKLPASTVRARLARGLAQLRERLDRRHHGQRELWAAACLRLPEAALVGTGTSTILIGITSMHVALKASLAAGVVILSYALWQGSLATLAPARPLEQLAIAAAQGLHARSASDPNSSQVVELASGPASDAEGRSVPLNAVPNAVLGQLFVVVDGEQALATGDAEICFSAALELNQALDSVFGLPVRAEARAGSGTICFSKNGLWSLPLPAQKMVVEWVRIGGQRQRILSGGQLEEGATHASLVVAPYAPCRLIVQLEGSDQVADELEIRATRAFVFEVGRSFVFPPGTHPVLSTQSQAPPGVAFAHRPTPQSELVALMASSPVSFASRDYSRELWVGRQGYQWEFVRLDPGVQQVSVILRPVGNLEVALVHTDQVQGALDLQLFRGRISACRWRDLRSDGVFVAKECGASAYRLRVSTLTQAGIVPLHELDVQIEAGGTQRVEVDFRALGLRTRGRMRIAVQMPTLESRFFNSYKLVVAPVLAGTFGAPGASRHQLRNLALEGGIRVARINHLPAGDYLVGIFPCGIMHVISVTDEEEANVTIDLSQIAEVSIWPDMPEEQSRRIPSRGPGRLRWQRVASTDPAEGFLPSSSITGPAIWIDGAWRFECLPGRVAFVVNDYSDVPIGQVHEQSVLAGPNDLLVTLAPNTELRVVVELIGAPRIHAASLEDELREALQAVLGGGKARFVRLLPPGSGNETAGLIAEIDVSRAGQYQLLFSEHWAKRFPGLESEQVTVGPGVTPRLNVIWQD